MKTLKNGKLKAGLITLLLSSTILSVPMKAHAQSPQDAVIDMAKNAVKSWGGEKLEALLFPKEGVDYDRIKKDMQEVTKKAITDAEIEKVLGEIGGSAQVAQTALYDSDPVTELQKARITLVMNISKISTGQFKVPGIGNYILGAQTEMSILTAMLEKAPVASSENTCNRACVLNTLSDRVDAHTTQLNSTVKSILDDAVSSSVSRVGACFMDVEYVDIGPRSYRILKGYMFSDSARGYNSPHYGKDSIAGCESARSDYMGKKKSEAWLTVQNGTKWMYEVRANWTKGKILAKPAQKETIIRTAMTESLPFILANQSSCYNQIIETLTRNPTSEACTIYKFFADKKAACPSPASDYQDLGKTLGCTY
jgi:hypothetical protein